jgi:hypothetical protein
VISGHWLIPPRCIPAISEYFDFDRRVLTYSVLWHHLKLPPEVFHDLLEPLLGDDRLTRDEVVVDALNGAARASSELQRIVLAALLSPVNSWADLLEALGTPKSSLIAPSRVADRE